MKKFFLSTFFVASFLMVNVALASEKSDKNPFEEIWKAIRILEKKIVDIQLIPGPKGEKGDQGESATVPHLYDANNQDLGVIIDANQGSSFTVFREKEQVYFSVRQSRVGDNPGAFIDPKETIFYSEKDCKGTPYSNNVRNPFVVISAFGNKLYQYTADPIARLQPLSVLEISTGCENSFPGAGDLFPLKEISLPLQFPLAWPLGIK